MFMALMKALSMSHVNIFVNNLCVCVVCVCGDYWAVQRFTEFMNMF